MPESIGNYGGNSSWSYPFNAGRLPEGIGSLLMMLFGNKMWPLVSPGTPQSQFDALWQRNHDMQMMQLSRNAMSSWFPFQNMGGMNQNSAFTQMATAMLSQPNGIAATLMAPVLGGNPIQAQMASLANLQGINTAGFGTLAGMSVGQLDSSRKVFESQFYIQRDPAMAREFQRKYNFGGYGIDTGDMFNKDYSVNRNSSGVRSLYGANDIINRVEGNEFGNDPEKLKAALKSGEVTGDLAKKITDAFNASIGKDIKDLPKKFADEIKTKGIGDIHNQIQALNHLQMVGGVDYTHTLGFNYEDLTGAMNSMIKNNLVMGKNVKGGLSGVAQIFGGSAGAYMPGLLDAVRGTIGNDKTGKEIGDWLSDFIGNSNINVADKKGAGQVEDVLRNLKSVARSSNIDFGAVMSMVEQARGYAGQSGATSMMGGMELGTMVTDTLKNVGALATGMDQRSLRWMGGTANMAQNMIAGSIESANQPISKQLAALHTYFAGNPEIQRQISNYARSGNLTAIGFTGFLKSLPGNTSELLAYAVNNETAQQVGFSNDPELMKAGGRSQVDSMFQRLFYHWGGGQVGYDKVREAQQDLMSGDSVKFLTNARTGVGTGVFANAWKDLIKKGYANDWTIANNPTMAKNAKFIDQMVKEGTTSDKEISRLMGRMNAPTMQRLVQAVISGDTGREGMSALFKSLGIADVNTDLLSWQKATETIGKIDQSGTAEDIVANAGYMSGTSSTLGALSTLGDKYGLSAADFNEIAKGGSSLESVKKMAAKKTGLDASAYEAIKNAASGLNNNDDVKKALAGYKGKDFSKGELSKFFKGNIIHGILYDSEQEKSIDKEFKGRLDKDITQMLTGGAGVDSKLLAKGLQGLGSEAYSVMGALGSEQTGYELGKDGKFTLTGSHLKMAEKMGLQTSFGTEAEAQTMSGSVNRIAGSNKEVANLVSAYTGHQAELKSEEDKAKEDSPSKLLNDILKTLQSLPDLVTKLNDIGVALGTKPTG